MKKGPLREVFEDYSSRIKRYLPLELVEVREARSTGKAREAARAEGERVRSRLAPGFVVALDERGRGFTTAGFAAFMERLMNEGRKRVSFVVGGPWGLDPELRAEADLVMRLSELTFPHDLARVVLAEQVYRAMTVIRGEPYSH